MLYQSTRNARHRASLKEALLAGLAPGGGLYLPERVPVVPCETVSGWRHRADFLTIATGIATAWFGEDLAAAWLDAIVREAYYFPLPLRSCGPWELGELFHGPTLSFKDIAAQFLMRLLDRIMARDNEQALILTATSGDTGSAVAAACHGRERLRAVILYPLGRISRVQEQQIATWGGNVTAVAVPGDFDDCQRLVKEALQHERLDGWHVTSANSINIGRLLPQTIYYWYFALRTAQPSPLTMVVPSGNFGNLTAGVLAKRMGAPIAGFIGATNANDAVPRYLATGRYAPRSTVPTMANAMDVGAPSNFERLRTLYHDDAGAMAHDITGCVITDAEAQAVMHEIHARHGLVIDPHTAMACAAAMRHPAAHALILATAHPAKFPDIVTATTGATPERPESLQATCARPLQRVMLPAATPSALHDLLKDY
ncbi:MAG: threonine synthase [Deltaproteobacteria bacterium]|nr:threonine synthase [Deltaproteobacteria bacterium]